MTEISNIKSGGQIISLKPAPVPDPDRSDSIERFGGVVPPSGESGPAPTTTPAASTKDQPPLEKAAQAIDEFIGDTGSNTKLRIDKDDDTGRFVYKSIDSESGEVVSQFPPETILQIISKFRDPEGLVLDDEA